jgi:hypothetical protein
VVTNRNIHLTKEVHHLVTGDPEFPCHVVHAQLAQVLPPKNERFRYTYKSYPLRPELSVDQLRESVAMRQLPITETDKPTTHNACLQTPFSLPLPA